MPIRRGNLASLELSRQLDTRKNRLIFGMLGALAPWRHDDRRQAA
jgi:hypothetical protein